LKNALVRGTTECRQWHPSWEPLCLTTMTVLLE